MGRAFTSVIWAAVLTACSTDHVGSPFEQPDSVAVKMPAMSGLAAGAIAILLGIGVLFMRYHRRERYVRLMPLAPLGYGLIAIGLLLALGVDSAWVAAVAIGSLFLAARRVPFVLLWEGRISTQLAALMYASILPVALLVFMVISESLSWLFVVMAGTLFVMTYGFMLAVLPFIVARRKNGEAPPK